MDSTGTPPVYMFSCGEAPGGRGRLGGRRYLTPFAEFNENASKTLALGTEVPDHHFTSNDGGGMGM